MQRTWDLFDRAAGAWVDWMSAMSWQVAVLAAVVLAVSLIARKASPRLRYMLWSLVLIKLCLPPSLSFVTGIGRWLPAAPIRAATVQFDAPPPVAEYPRVDVAVEPAWPAMPPPETIAAPSPVLSSPPLPAGPVGPDLSWPHVLLLVWGAGALAMAGIVLLQYSRLRSRLSQSSRVADPAVLDAFRQARERLGVRGKVGLLASPGLDSPILFGVLRPRVVVPAEALDNLPHDQLRPILLHELAHVRRRDLWVNWIQAVLQAIYWFHPLVWLANLRLRQEREMIVDDMVLTHLQGDAETYGTSLLNVLRQAARRRLLTPSYVGIAEPRGSIAHRLRRILDTNRKLSIRLGWLSAALVVVLALTLIPQGAAGDNKPRSDSSREASGRSGATTRPAATAAGTSRPGADVARNPFADMGNEEVVRVARKLIGHLKRRLEKGYGAKWNEGVREIIKLTEKAPGPQRSAYWKIRDLQAKAESMTLLRRHIRSSPGIPPKVDEWEPYLRGRKEGRAEGAIKADVLKEALDQENGLTRELETILKSRQLEPEIVEKERRLGRLGGRMALLQYYMLEPLEGEKDVEKLRKRLWLLRADVLLAEADGVKEWPVTREASPPATSISGSIPPAEQNTIIVARHVMLYQGRIVTWEDLDKLTSGLLPITTAHGHSAIRVVDTQGTAGRFDDIRDRTLALAKRHGVDGGSWSQMGPRTSKLYDAIKTEADLKAMRARPRLTGTIRLPDGTPATSADVILCDGPGEFSIYLKNGRSRDRQDEVMDETDRRGAFSVPAPDNENYVLVVLHERGLAVVRSDRLTRPPEITIHPWGRVEGQLRIGSGLGRQEGVTLSVMRTDDPDWPGITFTPFPPRDWPRIRFSLYELRTDDAGRLVVPHVPPGGVRITRSIEVNNGGSQSSHDLQVDVEGGKTTTVILGGTGRPVVGRIVMPKNLDMTLADVQVMYGRISVERPKPPYPDNYDSMGADQQQAWKRNWARTPAGEAYRRGPTSFAVAMESDGSFRVDDVPAGAHSLNVQLTPKDRSVCGGRPIGRAYKKFEIPEMPGGRSDEPFDLGEVPFEPAPNLKLVPVTPPAEGEEASLFKLVPRLKVGDTAPPFETKTLDGKPLKLADFRGKYVLLHFWATWCAPCLQEMPHLEATQKAFGANKRFVMVGLSLDKEAAAPRKYVAKHGLRWVQGHLGDWSKTPIPEAYAITGIPAAFLIGPDGKIVARDLGAEGIMAAVELAIGPALKGVAPATGASHSTGPPAATDPLTRPPQKVRAHGFIRLKFFAVDGR